MRKKAIIIGAGPAGLTAAYELLKRTDILPIIIEKDKQVGGISKTVDYKGNKMDFGPHRFFSKSDRVMNWWTSIMPLNTQKGEELTISYQNKSRTIDTGDFLTTEEDDSNSGMPPKKSMLIIPRLTRIYFLRQFFVYPIQLSIATLGQLGIWTTIKIVFSYLYARLFPRKPQNSLEDFMINKFGSVLYHIFFKDYTEKVWGIDCKNISADWGAQRVKGVSLSKAVLHAAKALTKRKTKTTADINQKDTETSLIEQFLYPATGAGAMWEEVARQVTEMGGRIVKNYDVKHLQTDGDQITGVEALNTTTGQIEQLEGDYFISTMPVQELIAGLKANVPAEVKEVAAGLLYRDFVYAGVLVKKMSIETPKDSWIYIQERDVKVARMQVYNNWGPYMVADPNTVWLGLEYFCTKGDEIWNLNDDQVEKLAVEELIKMELITAEDVLDSKVNRMEKTYPAYFGTYDRFEEIQKYLENFSNLFLVGRNGMHKYNNTDHSMLTAMVAVDNIEAGMLSKDNLWEINTEQEYHEVKNKPKTEIGDLNSKKPPLIKEIVLSGGMTMSRWFILIILSFLAFIVFKAVYPFPSFIHSDSFTYMAAANENKFLNIHLIGYSKFLRLFSSFTSSAVAIVLFQYGLSIFSLLFFITTLTYFYNLRNTFITLFIGLVLTIPFLLYLGNLIAADSLFFSLSAFWFSLLIWILKKPNTKILILHTIVIFLCFTLKYNAIIYPILSTVIIVRSQLRFLPKLAAVISPIALCAIFILQTGNAYKDLTGTWQYSPFSGWQLANNAMYAYRYVPASERKPVPAKFKALDSMICAYFDSTADFTKYPFESLKASTLYMWTPWMPLFQFRDRQYIKDTTMPEFNRWASIGPYYGEYGRMIIQKYPIHYLEHFAIPNLIKYYAPPAEFMSAFNGGRETVDPIAVKWFGYKGNRVYKNTKMEDQTIVGIYSLVSGTFNFILLAVFIIYLGNRKIWVKSNTKHIFYLSLLYWSLNCIFTVFSSAAALRFQAFPMIFAILLSIILTTWLMQEILRSSTSFSRLPNHKLNPTL